jgi:hypothetical protein
MSAGDCFIRKARKAERIQAGTLQYKLVLCSTILYSVVQTGWSVVIKNEYLVLSTNWCFVVKTGILWYKLVVVLLVIGGEVGRSAQSCLWFIRKIGMQRPAETMAVKEEPEDDKPRQSKPEAKQRPNLKPAARKSAAKTKSASERPRSPESPPTVRLQQMQPAPEEEGEQDKLEEIMPAAREGPKPPKIPPPVRLQQMQPEEEGKQDEPKRKIPPPRQTRIFSWKPGEGRPMPVVISARPGYPRYDGPAQQAVQSEGFCELYIKVEH